MLTCLVIVLTMAVLAAQLDVIGVLDFSGVATVRTLAVLVGVLGFLSIVVAMFPSSFSEGVRDFAKTFLLMGSALMVTLLVVTYTYSPIGTVKLAFRDLSFLDARVLLAVFGTMGLLGLLALVVREPRAVLDAPGRWKEVPPGVPEGTPEYLRERWVGLVSIVRGAGAALIAVVRPLLVLWDRFREDIAGAARPSLVLASALVIALLVGGLVTTTTQREQPSTPALAEGDASQTAASVAPVEGKQRGLSFRNDIWAASWRLVRDRPWFEYEDVSYSFARPLIGYGPELFKYTFPLESPLGGLLSHAHNFFIHHFVEQGILGGFASVGLVLSFFTVGVGQLWRSREEHSAAHRWILIALMATMVGRVAEMMVGVARESDLVTFWVLLATLVVLPSVMKPSHEAAGDAGRCPACGEENEPRARACARCGAQLETPAVEAASAEPGTRREERRARRERARRTRSSVGPGAVMSPLRVLVLTVMSMVIVFVGWLSWDKNVDYAWAATIAATARDNFSGGDLQTGHRLMARAIAKAPDVPIYYHNVSGIYDAYRQFVTSNEGDFQSCEAFFSLEPREGRSQLTDGTFAECAEESYLNNLKGFSKNMESPQNKLILANSAMTMAVLGYDGLGDETIRYYDELTDMLPKSWHLEDSLGKSQVRLGRYQDALDGFEQTISKAGGPGQRAQSLYLQGLAHNGLGQRPEAIASFEKSLDEPSSGGVAPEARQRLLNAYDAQVVEQLNAKTEDEALATLEKYVARTDGSTAAARPLYLKGVAYRQLEDLDLDLALEALQESLEADGEGSFAADVHRLLSTVYTELGDTEAAAEHSRLSEELRQG